MDITVSLNQGDVLTLIVSPDSRQCFISIKAKQAKTFGRHFTSFLDSWWTTEETSQLVRLCPQQNLPCIVPLLHTYRGSISWEFRWGGSWETPASDPTKRRFPGVSLSVSEPTRTHEELLLSSLFLKKQQREKLNNGLGSLPMYSVTAAASMAV